MTISRTTKQSFWNIESEEKTYQQSSDSSMLSPSARAATSCRDRFWNFASMEPGLPSKSCFFLPPPLPPPLPLGCFSFFSFLVLLVDGFFFTFFPSSFSPSSPWSSASSSSVLSSASLKTSSAESSCFLFFFFCFLSLSVFLPRFFVFCSPCPSPFHSPYSPSPFSSPFFRQHLSGNPMNCSASLVQKKVLLVLHLQYLLIQSNLR